MDTFSEANRLARKLSAVDRLRAFTVTADYITGEKKSKSDYFILELEEKAHQIKVTQFSGKDLEQATARYLELERRATKDPKYDVVLVSASSVNNLRAAYPNYFADSKEFLKYMNRALSV